MMLFLDRKILQYQVRDALIYWVGIPGSVVCSGKIIDFALQLSMTHLSNIGIISSMVLVGAGLAIIWRAMRDFAHHGRGTPNPRRPPRVLVRRGVYGMCRHPMFLGYDLAALGIVLLSRSPGMLAASYPLFLLIQIRFLRREEAYLARRFREDFEEYRQRVPFLIPFPQKRSK